MIKTSERVFITMLKNMVDVEKIEIYKPETKFGTYIRVLRKDKTWFEKELPIEESIEVEFMKELIKEIDI